MHYTSEYNDHDKDPDNVYVNIRINHDKLRSYTTLAAYDVTKTSPYIYYPANFYCSVVSVAVPLDSLPLGIVKTEIDPLDSLNPNYMTSSISITTPAGATPTPLNTITVHLQFIPNGSFPPPIPNPTPTNPSGQTISPYYYFYTYSTILQCFNNALLSAFNTQFPAGPVAAAGAPYFFMDYKTNLISLVVSNLFTISADIYVNLESLYYLQAFNMYALLLSPDARTNFKFVFYKFNNNCDAYGQNVGAVGNNYWIYTQEYYALQEITSTRKILFVTNYIPINPEYISVNNPDGVQTGTSSTSNVLFDYTPNIKSGSDAKDVNYFENTYPRLVDLQGTNPLSRIDLQVFWQDVQGNVYPLYISPNEAINIKLGFFRKSLFKNNWKKIKLIQ